MADLFYPGDPIARQSIDDCEGEGTHVDEDGFICASVMGHLHILEKDNRRLYKIAGVKEQGAKPEIGDVVVGKITQISGQVNVQILLVNDQKALEGYNGIIRPKDIDRDNKVSEIALRTRNTTYEDEIATICASFRRGDIVMCRAVALAESGDHYLSTFGKELGVLFAKSVHGTTLVPLSPTQMRCPHTGITEHRKVAIP